MALQSIDQSSDSAQSETADETTRDELLDEAPPNRHTHSSTHREQILEHVFVGELLRYIWKHHRNEGLPEVTYTDVDNGGYDLIIEWRETVRHIQLKSTISGGGSVRLNESLSNKPCGCVVLMTCDEDLTLVGYRWFGGPPGTKLALDRFDRARQTRADSMGEKKESISSRRIPRGTFEKLTGIGQLVDRLFPKNSI